MKDETYERVCKMLKVCDGCQTHVAGACQVRQIAGSSIRPNKYVPDGWDCPCSECLVKAICTKALDCPDLQNYYAVSAYCKGHRSNSTAELVFLNYLDRKFKSVSEYPEVIRYAVEQAFGYPK